MDTSTTVAGYLASRLPDMGVSYAFELIGGMIAGLIDELHREPGIEVVSVLHEQAAGFSAEGYARMSGKPAVALATSGPGATNLLTAVASCYFDSVPVVFITGQVNRAEIHEPGRGRQLGFQETDIVSMALPVTKSSIQVRSSAEFPAILEEAFALATSGRPGPVLIDIPMDVQWEILESSPRGGSKSSVLSNESLQGNTEIRANFIERLRDALKRSERPLILAGGGIRSAGAVAGFRSFVERAGIPVVQTLLGLDSLSAASQGRVGFIGSYGNRWANWALGEADLLLVLGSRLDIRQTGSDVEGFRRAKDIFHVDVDPGELNNRVDDCFVLSDDLLDFLNDSDLKQISSRVEWKSWQLAISESARRFPDTAENIPKSGINPNKAVREIAEIWPETGCVVADVGQHQMWVAQSYPLTDQQRFITSGGLGAMGFGLPAAIGASLAHPGAPTLLIAGDGGFQCNIQELQTIARLQLPIRIVVFNNQSHGMVRQFQQSYLDERYFSTRWGYEAPAFASIAEAYGIRSWEVADHDSLKLALRAARNFPESPALIEVAIDPDLNAYPKMAFGQPFGSMEPLVSPRELEGT